MENHCVVSKLHSDFVLLCLLKVQTTTFDNNFTIMHIKPLRTGTAPPLVNGRRHDDPMFAFGKRRSASSAYASVFLRKPPDAAKSPRGCGHFRRFSEGKWRRKPRSRNCHLPTASIRALRMTSLSGAQQSVLPRRLNTVVFLWKTVRPDGQVRNMGCAPFTPASRVRT